MEKRSKKQSFRNITFSSDDASLSLYDSVKKLAEKGLEGKEYLTYDELLFQLRRWWCQYYKRPYKDPLLDAYTFEELLFEYFDITRERDSERDSEQKISEEVEAEDRAWAEEEAAREEAEEAALQAAEAESSVAHTTPEDDTIVEEAVGLTDAQWADKYSRTLVNPTADQVDSEDGDISAKFEG